MSETRKTIRWTLVITHLILGAVCFAAGYGCAGTDIKMSPVEEVVDEYPELAAYGMCIRGNQIKESTAGQNVMLCDKVFASYQQKQEFEACKRSFGGVIVEGKEYTSQEAQSVVGVQAYCYLTIYDRQDDLDSIIHKQHQLKRRLCGEK